MYAVQDYQADGFVGGFGKESLARANRELASAKNATPEHKRDLYRAQIRSNKTHMGYNWYWVIK